MSQHTRRTCRPRKCGSVLLPPDDSEAAKVWGAQVHLRASGRSVALQCQRESLGQAAAAGTRHSRREISLHDVLRLLSSPWQIRPADTKGNGCCADEAAKGFFCAFERKNIIIRFLRGNNWGPANLSSQATPRNSGPQSSALRATP